MNATFRRLRTHLSLALWLLVTHQANAQIFWIPDSSSGADKVLNAPYRGTVDSLRSSTLDVPYGEVRTWIEPTSSTPLSSQIEVWHNAPPGGDLHPWDRSILRLYNGLDASGDEINLTEHVSEMTALTVTVPEGEFKRFSLKAIGTKSFGKQKFEILFRYTTSSTRTVSRTFYVAPMTGSFQVLPGLSEAFHYGTQILDVSVGGADLVVPIGQTADLVGAAFLYKRDTTGPSDVDSYDVVLPGAAESVWMPDDRNFLLSDPDTSKTDWGTPWAGYLRGYYCLGPGAPQADERADAFAPDGTHFDSDDSPTNNTSRHFNLIRPFGVSDTHAAVQVRAYLGDLVTSIADTVGPNSISINRAAADHLTITASDGRSWQIDHDANGRITGVIPSSNRGARYFSWSDTLENGGRVTEVRTSPTEGQDVLYKFVYYDTGLDTGDLKEEWRQVDGALRKVVEHFIVDDESRYRLDYFGAGDVRRMDLEYDATATPPLRHRLAKLTTYKDNNPTPGTTESYETVFEHVIEDDAGTMVIDKVTLPNGTYIEHKYENTGPETVHFGLRTKSIHHGLTQLILYDVDYEFFYGTSPKRLFYAPRLVKQRDGRHNAASGFETEVTFDYEDGGVDQTPTDGLTGERSNQLLSRVGPGISAVPANARTPATTYVYDPTSRVLTDVTRTVGPNGELSTTHYGYDALLRRTSVTVDFGGKNLTTQYLYCDALNGQQAQTTIDADGFAVKSYFDNDDGRFVATRRFLTAAPTWTDACSDPPGKSYDTFYAYDGDGWLQSQTIDNKDQDGNALSPATIVSNYAHDAIGRLTLETLDPGGIGQESNFDYDWQGGIERQFDTSGRGFAQTLDGRGLVDSRTPLALSEAPDTNLTTTFQYDAVGNLRFTNSPTGAIAEQVYDDFSRVEKSKRVPKPGSGGNLITTTFSYDAANNVTRTVVDEATVGVLADSTAKFDEGGFNYESRQRTVEDADSSVDPVTEHKFDWAGNVIEERSLGDTTVAHRVITTEYDNASRVDKVIDSESGQTDFTPDGRGNVTVQTVKLTATDTAVTTTKYDALSRAFDITEPEDANDNRADRLRSFDSRGNLLRETLRDSSDNQMMTTVFAYDNAGRQTRRAVLNDADSAVDAANVNKTLDRVIDFEYDANGRPTFRHAYNNGVDTQRTTSTTYDVLGRTLRVTDPSASYTEDTYDPNTGRLTSRDVDDGGGVRTTTFAYDGHDRVLSQTRQGSPNLTTSFQLDGLDRPIRVFDPKSIITKTDYDLVGRRIASVEDEAGELERRTDFEYNRLSQLTQRAVKNAANNGAPLDDQLTTFRSDSLGRPTRTVLPDADPAEHGDPSTCTNCVRMQFDLAGRMTTRTEQRGNVTSLAYDDRGRLLTRTTDTDVDTFDYDALGRTTLAQRGTTAVANAVSESVMDYTDLGDLDFETQTITAGMPQTVNYTYDQAGNRTQVTYPSVHVLAYTPTAINQIDAIDLDGSLLVDYEYDGLLLDRRTTTTDDPSGSVVYEFDPDYDSHRRISSVLNSVTTPARQVEAIGDYAFSYDDNGNPVTQLASSDFAEFEHDDRIFEVDPLDRLIRTTYVESGTTEKSILDLAGNREEYTARTGHKRNYDPVNAANEYSTIDGESVAYDLAGNLMRDEKGREYFYDEQNRLTTVTDGQGTDLAYYTYDAFGRRIVFEEPVGGTVTRYYYDGQSCIEERDGSDVLERFHVLGSQFIDEHIATHDATANAFVYYLPNRNFTVAATGNADGSNIRRVDLGATGAFDTPGTGYFFDSDSDGDVDVVDFIDFIDNCFAFSGPNVPYPDGCDEHDADVDGDVDTDDFTELQNCGGGVTPPIECRRTVSFYHDANGDRDIDLEDFTDFVFCQEHAAFDPACVAKFDFDLFENSDGWISTLDYAKFQLCFSGADVIASEDCLRSLGFDAAPPTSGDFGLHGRPVDVLSDGKVLTFIRARYYDAEHGRWLQRDPKGFVDGSNLYESFGSNPARNTDPMGTMSAPHMALNMWFIGGILERLGIVPTLEEWAANVWQGPKRRVIRVFGGFVDFESGLFHFGDLDDDSVQTINQMARHGLSLPLRGMGRTTHLDTYVVGAQFAGLLFSFIPILPIDYLIDRGLLEMEFNQFDGSEPDQMAWWLYTHPRAHLAIRVLPDVVPVAGYGLTSLNVGARLRSSAVGAKMTGGVRRAGNAVHSRYQRLLGTLVDAKPGKYVVGSGISPGQVGRLRTSTSNIVVSKGSHVLDLNGAWRQTQYVDEGLVYLLGDASTGEILKVGQTTAQKSLGRFEKYVTAGNKTGKRLALEVFEVPLDQRGVIERQIRRLLGAQPGSLPWDNTGRRLGRPGPGTPSVPQPTRRYPQ